MTDLEAITNKVSELCSEVAEYIRGQALLFSRSDEEEKGRQNLVTYVDRTSEEMLVQGLTIILPGSEFLAEENDYEYSGNGYTWVIDPLDGTTNFVHGLPIYSISVGLMKDEKILCGVVYHVPAKECFYAWKQGGAYVNGERLYASPRESLDDSLLVTGFPYRHGGKLDQYIEIFKELVHKCRGVRRLGSAAIDLCYVAAGRLEGFYEYGLNPWDVAAGSLIVQEAGGKVTDFRYGSGYLFGEELIATNGVIHDELLEIITRHFL